jgi:SAM-dependent methyltransferase
MFYKFKVIYLKEQFNPKVIGLLINPFYFARKGLYRNISKLMRNIDGKVLDVGCGQRPYKSLCHSTEYIGLELDTVTNRLNKKADYFYDGKVMPFEDSCFDSLISNQVFEHVFNPDEFLSEVNRVLKLDGKLLMTVPFVWDEHEQPFDYARYSSFGLKHILKTHGFEIIDHKKSASGVELIFQLINNYIYKIFYTNNSYINLLISLILIAPLNITGLILSLLFPENNDLYLDNILLAKKIKSL